MHQESCRSHNHDQHLGKLRPNNNFSLFIYLRQSSRQRGKQQIRYHQCCRRQRHHHRLVLLPHPSNANKTRQCLQEIIIQNSQIIREKQGKPILSLRHNHNLYDKTQQPKVVYFPPNSYFRGRKQVINLTKKTTAWRIQK